MVDIMNGTSVSDYSAILAKKFQIKRYMFRAYTGVECGLSKNHRFRSFILSESNEIIDSGDDFGKAFHLFMTWLRYTCKDFQYIAVEHRQGDKWRRNWHVLSYGSDKLPMKKMDYHWQKVYGSWMETIKEVKDFGDNIMYSAGYLKSSGKGDKFERAWCSHGWIFPGWFQWSKRCHKRWGTHPPAEKLVKLSNMAKLPREELMADVLLRGNFDWSTWTFQGWYYAEFFRDHDWYWNDYGKWITVEMAALLSKLPGWKRKELDLQVRKDMGLKEVSSSIMTLSEYLSKSEVSQGGFESWLK